MIIKTNKGDFIKVEDDDIMPNDAYCWGWRWNRNEQRFGTQCILYRFDSYKVVDEADLPQRLPEIEVK